MFPVSSVSVPISPVKTPWVLSAIACVRRSVKWVRCAFACVRRSVKWVRCAFASVMCLLQLRYEHDSSTIRLRFDYDSATARYEMRTIRLRFERDTTSYEELCAFEQ